jgi:hypothetical protein
VPSAVGVLGTPARQPDPASAWSSRRQRPRGPLPCRSRVPDQGTTEKPLDGDAPTLRWTRAPARGLAVGPPAGRRRSPLTRALAWAEEGAGGIGEKEMELGLARVNGEGFLFRRDARVAVDRDRTVDVVPRVTGPLLAQAGKGKRGPGPGCLGPERERPRGGARGDAGRALAGRARVNEPGFCAGPRGVSGPAGSLATESAVQCFLNFQKSIFNRICLNLMHFKFKLE